MQVRNGTPASELPVAQWRKSQASNPSGCCVEVAELPGGAIAVRNSRDPSGPALVYTRAEIGAFLTGTKNGEFDDLYPGASATLPSGRPSGGLTRLVAWQPRRFRMPPGLLCVTAADPASAVPFGGCTPECLVRIMRFWLMR